MTKDDEIDRIFVLYTLYKTTERIFYTHAKPTIGFICKNAIRSAALDQEGRHFYSVYFDENWYVDSSGMGKLIVTRFFLLSLMKTFS